MKKRKLKIQTKNKQYSFIDSCFYKLESKKRLSSLLNIDLSTLQTLTNNSNYNCYTDCNGSKPRDIEHPNFNLDKVQTRIASLVCRIKQPNYIHSGIKGRSNITNAEKHIGDHNVLTSDIQSFYQNTSKKMVFNFFYKKMKCSADISDLLARLCTCRGHIPTGSRISMPLAFWANEPMFEQLYKLSVSKNVTFTIFVDDIVFSGFAVNKTFLYKINKIILRFGHAVHPKKTKLYSSGEVKVVTGIAVDKRGLMVANKHRNNIHKDMLQWEDNYIAGVKDESLNNRVIGRMNAQSLVDYRFKDKVRTLKNSIKNS